MFTALVMAMATLTCVGSGVTLHEGAPRTDSQRGDRWLDNYNNAHDGYTASLRIEDGETFRLTMPSRMIDFPAYVPMVKLSDDGRKMTAARSMGTRRFVVMQDHERSRIVITAPEGSFSGTCRKK